jgi:hypothetical protein
VSNGTPYIIPAGTWQGLAHSWRQTPTSTTRRLSSQLRCETIATDCCSVLILSTSTLSTMLVRCIVLRGTARQTSTCRRTNTLRGGLVSRHPATPQPPTVAAVCTPRTRAGWAVNFIGGVPPPSPLNTCRRALRTRLDPSGERVGVASSLRKNKKSRH